MKSTAQIAIDGVPYEAERDTDDAGLGYIEVRDPLSRIVYGRVLYHGPHLPMEITTCGQIVPRAVMEWLLERADDALAFSLPDDVSAP